MKRFYHLIALAVATLLLLSACGSELAIEREPAFEPAVEAETAGEIPAPVVITSPDQFDLVGNAGKPQFIDSYAEW